MRVLSDTEPTATILAPGSMSLNFTPSGVNFVEELIFMVQVSLFFVVMVRVEEVNLVTVPNTLCFDEAVGLAMANMRLVVKSPLPSESPMANTKRSVLRSASVPSLPFASLIIASGAMVKFLVSFLGKVESVKVPSVFVVIVPR